MIPDKITHAEGKWEIPFETWNSGGGGGDYRNWVVVNGWDYGH